MYERLLMNQVNGGNAGKQSRIKSVDIIINSLFTSLIPVGDIINNNDNALTEIQVLYNGDFDTLAVGNIETDYSESLHDVKSLNIEASLLTSVGEIETDYSESLHDVKVLNIEASLLIPVGNVLVEPVELEVA